MDYDVIDYLLTLLIGKNYVCSSVLISSIVLHCIVFLMGSLIPAGRRSPGYSGSSPPVGVPTRCRVKKAHTSSVIPVWEGQNWRNQRAARCVQQHRGATRASCQRDNNAIIQPAGLAGLRQVMTDFEKRRVRWDFKLGLVWHGPLHCSIFLSWSRRCESRGGGRPLLAQADL